MIYLTYENAKIWCDYFNGRPGYRKVNIHEVEGGWTIY